jgi:hypothetical protein
MAFGTPISTPSGKIMLRSGESVSTQWRTINRHGARSLFHKGEIISVRDAVENRRSRMVIGGSAILFATPIEYNMGLAYGGQLIVHVGASNTAVTTGTLDPISGLQVYSSPGWYISNPNGVPVLGTDDSPAYLIPQVPLPFPDDVDNQGNFWLVFIGEGQCY